MLKYILYLFSLINLESTITLDVNQDNRLSFKNFIKTKWKTISFKKKIAGGVLSLITSLMIIIIIKNLKSNKPNKNLLENIPVNNPFNNTPNQTPILNNNPFNNTPNQTPILNNNPFNNNRSSQVDNMEDFLQKILKNLKSKSDKNYTEKELYVMGAIQRFFAIDFLKKNQNLPSDIRTEILLHKEDTIVYEYMIIKDKPFITVNWSNNKIENVANIGKIQADFESQLKELISSVHADSVYIEYQEKNKDDIWDDNKIFALYKPTQKNIKINSIFILTGNNSLENEIKNNQDLINFLKMQMNFITHDNQGVVNDLDGYSNNCLMIAIKDMLKITLKKLKKLDVNLYNQLNIEINQFNKIYNYCSQVNLDNCNKFLHNIILLFKSDIDTINNIFFGIYNKPKHLSPHEMFITDYILHIYDLLNLHENKFPLLKSIFRKNGICGDILSNNNVPFNGLFGNITFRPPHDDGHFYTIEYND